MRQVINNSIEIPFESISKYEKKYGLCDKHNKLLSCLVEFDEFCRENQVEYSLCDGTLLGAVRHGDFIPWDDDADVMITRKEYEKIKSIINSQSHIKLFKICFLDRISTDELLKEGIYIDLFINDYYIDGFDFYKKVISTKFLRCSFLNVYEDYYHGKYITMILYHTLKYIADFFVGRRDVFELNDSMFSEEEGKKAKIYTRYSASKAEMKKRFSKSKYDQGYADIKFRGVVLRSIKNFNDYLLEMYGSNYMELPPESKRVPEHEKNMLDAPINCIKKYN